ncbi:MAG: hypothetical protein RXO24_07215 [Acidilobus sp.]|jgi:hypothetical protein
MQPEGLLRRLFAEASGLRLIVASALVDIMYKALGLLKLMAIYLAEVSESSGQAPSALEAVLRELSRP